ncbi:MULTISPECIES: ABC transporter ATP-binding protein [unclassified Hyphomonas]|jgi:phospholipid/cholesterol/gamma-HCH transport system ATP-binding protein|uniref:ABC transporter ATP-binding protein n=1 Tax=unclassified Hyphomonas TaxID=2630699 RepID=UPI000459179B|nr:MULTISPECIES: ATP-binding cassette domain-containing protein [unclassified Hyphomonas]KCZ48897.1 iron ABC transporter ATP-binding protein [Hyphomonas sp. CY54-11-8]RAN40344.1 iron ABC transporter ATP-binding protein [Hyphomonas sp. GM-8P]
MTDDIIIRIRDLKTAYGTHVVHEHLDLDIRRGEIIGIIGPSGCGKSVLLRAITGLKEFDTGSIEVFGERLETLDEVERAEVEQRWGVMFQDGALFSNLTVRENVEVPMKEHTQLEPVLRHQLADMKIRMAGLSAEASPKYPSDLSGGMRKRAALARALALDPELLFLDEPTAGLDPITAEKFDALIRSLQQALGLTVFLVTHDVDTLHATCDRIAVLGEKHVLAVGTIEELRAFDHPWVQEYFCGPRGRAATGH